MNIQNYMNTENKNKNENIEKMKELRKMVNYNFYGNEKDGILTYVNELKNELRDAMLMCGARKLSDISFDMVRLK